MPRLMFTLLVLSLACGGSEGSETSSTTSSSSSSSTSAPSSGSEQPTQTPSNSNVPSDFSIRQGGGPVQRGDDPERQTSLEPTGSGFVLVVRDVPQRGEPTEVSRVEVDPQDVEPVYELIVSRREELGAECVNANIRGGTTRSFHVVLDGAEVEFRCTNSATPAFEALAEAFDELVITNTPAH